MSTFFGMWGREDEYRNPCNLGNPLGAFTTHIFWRRLNVWSCETLSRTRQKIISLQAVRARIIVSFT